MEAGDPPKWEKKLWPSDEVAVEITGYTQLFYDAVASHLARVLVVSGHVKLVLRAVSKRRLRALEEDVLLTQ
jgi:hypothetical protein